MERYRANPNPNAKNPSTTSAAPGFESLYASLFGSGERQDFNTNQPTSPSANESLYPSSPYQPRQMPTSPQMHSGSVGQTPNGLSYGTHPSDKWHHPSRPSPSPPKHQEEPCSIGPFDSIWSIKSSEMAGANVGVQHQQQKPGNWSSNTSVAPGYRDSHASMSATNGLPFGGYDQHAYGGNDVGFHGDTGGLTSPGYAWSTYDGVNDANVPGLADWHWNQREYSPSMQSEHRQSRTHEGDGNMENHAVNEWELHDEELARKNREEDMKGRQERREWKKKGINHPEPVPDGVHKQKSHASPPPKTFPNDKVVASFLEKYRDNDPVAFTPGSSMDSDEHIILGTRDEVRESQCPSNVFEELGAACAEKGGNTDVSFTVQATDGGCHISGKSPSSGPERCNPTEEHQETTSNIDSSDLVDHMEGREVRSLSDPVTVQDAQQNNNVKSETASRKALSNGKIRPGKRKPKLPRDKRRNIVAQAEKPETKSCEKQTVQTETKDQPESTEKNTRLDNKGTGLNPNPSSKPLNNISSESIVQSSRPTPVSRSIPENTSKAQKASSKASCQNVPSRHHGSDIKTCFVETSICDDCACTATCDSKTNAPSGIVFPTVSVKENIGIKKDNKSSGLSSDKSSRKLENQSIKSLEKNHVSPTSSEKNEKSSSCVNDLSTAEKVVCSDHKTQRKNSIGMTSIQQHDVQTVPQKDNSDGSRHVRNTVSSNSPNARKKDIGKSTRSIPVQNQTPSCEPNSNSAQNNLRLTDEMKPVNGNNLPTTMTTGSSKKINDKTTSGLTQGQEKKNTKDSGMFFDPKRIFGGQKTVKIATQKPSKEADMSTNPTPAERIPKNSHLTDSQSCQAKEKVHVQAAKAEQCFVLPDPPVVQRPANLTKSVRSGMNEGEMNGTLPSKDLPPHPAQTVPSSSAKDALASKASAIKAEPVSSQQRSGEPTLPSEPRPARMYSYKKDDKTGVLRRSSDPKVEEATKYQSPRRDSSGNQSSSDEAKGERRCSGEAHMDGFHHPFGCSAHCYRRSSSPSSSRSSSNSRPASSGVNTGSSASSDKRKFSQAAGQNAQHVFPQPENSSPVFEASAFAELREGLKNSWLSKEKEKQREDQKQRQEKVQKEHLERVQQEEQRDQKRQQEKQEQKRQQEKQDLKKRQEKRQESASQHAKRPTRATYSKPKDPKPATSEHKAKDKRPGTSQARPGHGTSTQQPSRPWPNHTEPRPQTASQEDSTEESDMEEDLTRGFTDEWWFKFGKKFTKGVCWLILFTLLLCLVLLSFLLALARDTCKFAYHRGWDLWAWYTEKPPQDDEFFSSHRSYHRESGFPGSNQNNQSESGGGSWFFGSGQNQQGQTGGGGGGGGGGGRSWSHTGAGSQNQEPAARAKQPRKKQTQNIELPSTELAAIRRLLGCDPGNYYQVVGVAEDASEEDIKKFYRKQCMLVHPDKTDQPQANEAFQVLQKAYAILSDPTKRSEYHIELDYKEHLEDKVNDFYKKMSEMADSMPCGACMKSHKRYETDLPAHAARYCAAHDTRHPVKDGALWKETANLGFKIYVFLCDGHTVYDVTEWAACQNLEWLEANTCRLLCKVKRGGRSGQQRRQQHTAGYEEMFDDIFGSGAFRQFQSSADQQSHNGNNHHGNSHHGSGGSHGHSQQGGGSRNKGVKKSRKKKK